MNYEYYTKFNKIIVTLQHLLHGIAPYESGVFFTQHDAQKQSHSLIRYSNVYLYIIFRFSKKLQPIFYVKFSRMFIFYFTCNHLLSSTCVQHAKTFAKHLQKCFLLYWPKPIHCNYQFVHYSGFCRISPSILNRFKPNLQAQQCATKHVSVNFSSFLAQAVSEHGAAATFVNLCVSRCSESFDCLTLA